MRHFYCCQLTGRKRKPPRSKKVNRPTDWAGWFQRLRLTIQTSKKKVRHGLFDIPRAIKLPCGCARVADRRFELRLDRSQLKCPNGHIMGETYGETSGRRK